MTFKRSQISIKTAKKVPLQPVLRKDPDTPSFQPLVDKLYSEYNYLDMKGEVLKCRKQH
jgi:hypothetical protein